MQWYKININDLTADLYEKYYNLMTNERKEYVSSFKNTDARKRTVAAEMLIKNAIGDDNLLITKDQHGKPFIKDCNKHINISHSGDYAACAISNSPVGIDIEKLRDINIKAAEKFCNSAELDYIYSFDSTNRFFEIWTAKEAAFKLCGGKEKNFKLIDTFNINKQYFRFLDYIVCIATERN